MERQLAKDSQNPGLIDEKAFRRRLTGRDLERMRLPARFHHVTFDGVPDGGPKHVVRKFWIGMGTIFEPGEIVLNGWSALFTGDNDTGKTGAASVILKEARRRGFTCLFIRAQDYRSSVIDKEKFDGVTTVKQRCSEVDFLVLDDLGKEGGDEFSSSSGSERMFEDLLRDRCGNRKVTVITTNATKQKMLSRYERSMLDVVGETFIIVPFDGVERTKRKQGEQLILSFFNSPLGPQTQE